MTHTMTDLLLRDCSTCGEQRAFEALVCADGHGAECPELACTHCGEAIFAGSLDVEVVARARPPLPVAEAA